MTPCSAGRFAGKKIITIANKLAPKVCLIAAFFPVNFR
jgi:hypothetical protein